jgi:hypothetical protein
MVLSCLLTIAAAATSAATFSATATATVAAATATTAAPSSTITTAAAATSTARGTIFTGPSFVDRQRTALEVFGMEHLNGLLGVLFGSHLDKGETAGTARHSVLHDINRHDNSGLREIILQVVFRRREGKITDE